MKRLRTLLVPYGPRRWGWFEWAEAFHNVLLAFYVVWAIAIIAWLLVEHFKR